MDKKKKKRKIKLIILILIIIICIATFLCIYHITNRESHSVSHIQKDNYELTGTMRSKSNIEDITIKYIDFVKKDDKDYIAIDLQNESDDNKYNFAISIKIINTDGDNIFTTGAIKNYFFANDLETFYGEIDSTIIKDKDIIDHIEINKLD